MKDMKLKIFDNLVKRRFNQKDIENKKVFILPNGRNDVTDLEEWLHLMMQRADKIKAYTLKEHFDYHQFVYGACIKEIVKQV